MEEAVLDVLRKGRISNMDITVEFEKEFAEWLGVKYAPAHNTGTAVIHSTPFGLGIGKGDEIICPSVTYWASCIPVFSPGGNEAARIDGCTPFATFIKIYFPLSRPVYATLGILKSVYVWDDFFYPLIMTTSDKMRTVQLGLQSYRNFALLQLNNRSRP